MNLNTERRSSELINENDQESEWFRVHTELHQDFGALVNYYVAICFEVNKDMESCELNLPSFDGGTLKLEVNPKSRFVINDILGKEPQIFIPMHNGYYNQLVYSNNIHDATKKYIEIQMAFNAFASLYQVYLDERPERNRFSALEIL